jgi:predicted anti-sigma-YlaC factor YlaD
LTFRGNQRPPIDDTKDMSCENWQLAISARLDGEDPGVEARLLDAHLATCADCRGFEAAARASQRAVRLQPAPEMADVSHKVVRLNAVADRAGRSPLARAALLVVAGVVIAFAMKDLVGGHETGATEHEARHLGAFTVAYGVALLAVVWRPARARTVLPAAAVLAGSLAITSVIDILEHNIPLLGESIHIPELLSVLLIWLLAVPAHGPRSKQVTPGRRLSAVVDASPAGDPTDPPADRFGSPRNRHRSIG